MALGILSFSLSLSVFLCLVRKTVQYGTYLLACRCTAGYHRPHISWSRRPSDGWMDGWVSGCYSRQKAPCYVLTWSGHSTVHRATGVFFFFLLAGCPVEKRERQETDKRQEKRERERESL
ncbi:hypothetical protein GGR50DRAFT_650510 [Xylaria sp. CBS 124048]|nr:hypothetical protein GGR50DRAFT_650510 [Xylaria sp. CBS 124048]